MTTIQPPGEQRKEHKRSWEEKDEEVGTERAETSKVLSQLHTFGRSPLRAVPLFHQQGHQALDFKQGGPNSIPLTPSRALKKFEQLGERVTHVISQGGFDASDRLGNVASVQVAEDPISTIREVVEVSARECSLVVSAGRCHP